MAPPAASAVNTTTAAAAEARLLASINAARAAHGARALAADPALTDRARAHAAEMAAEGDAWHSPDSLREALPPRIYHLSENVAFALGAGAVHAGIMASDEHRAILLADRFTWVGVGAVAGGPVLYVVELFGGPRTAPAPVVAPAPSRSLDMLRRVLRLGN